MTTDDLELRNAPTTRRRFLKIAVLLPANGYTEFLGLMSQAGIFVNLIFMFLNLLPILPLDGGRIVASLLPIRAAWRYSKLEPFGLPLLVILLFTNVLGFVLGHLRLDEERRLGRIDAGGEPVDHHVEPGLLQVAGLLVVGGERMPVGDEEKARVFRLQADPVLQHAVVVAEVQRAGGAHAGEDARFEHQSCSTVPMTRKEACTIGPSRNPR